MWVRGIRGATTVVHNEKSEMLTATSELLREIVRENDIQPSEIGCIFITVTQDLDAAFPAVAIREIAGWEMVPLMCSVEIAVQGALPKCIRLMVMVNTTKEQHEVKHVYLNEATKLRPDLAQTGK